MRLLPVAIGMRRNQFMLTGNTYSLIHNWRRGRSALPTFPTLANLPIADSNFTLRIEKCLPLYKSTNIPDQHFETAWENTRDYVDRCRSNLNIPDYRQLTHEQVNHLDRIIPESPTESCYPLYFITICEPIRSIELTSEGQRIEHNQFYSMLPDASSNEQVVYVGKTFARHRFVNGHHAFTKLLRPEYEGMEKWLYLARLVYIQAGESELPLEWIHEVTLAKELLASAEGQLIFSFDPELNDKNETINHTKNFAIHNFVNPNSVLNGIIGCANVAISTVPFVGTNVVGQ